MGPKVEKGPGILVPHRVEIAGPLVARLYIFNPSYMQLECARQDSRDKINKHLFTFNYLHLLYQFFIVPQFLSFTLAFYLKDLKVEDNHSLFSRIYDEVAARVVRIVGWKIRRNHPTTGGCEVCTTP